MEKVSFRDKKGRGYQEVMLNSQEMFNREKGVGFGPRVIETPSTKSSLFYIFPSWFGFFLRFPVSPESTFFSVHIGALFDYRRLLPSAKSPRKFKDFEKYQAPNIRGSD